MSNHDNLYRKLFSSPLMVRDLIKGFVREDWVRELNFEVMEPIESSFISDGLKRREADVIWRIQWRERWLYVYVLIEMQSTVDPMMAVRLLNYVSLLYQEIVARKELPKGRKLPPGTPYHDLQWQAPLDCCDQFVRSRRTRIRFTKTLPTAI